MDRNQIIGFTLIGALLIAFMIYNQPSEEQLQNQRRTRDSIAQLTLDSVAKSEEIKAQSLIPTQILAPQDTAVNSLLSDSLKVLQDSIHRVQLYARYGIFAEASTGDADEFTLENELLKLTVSAKGGAIIEARLKQYQTHDSLPLLVMDRDSSSFAISFFDDRRAIYTDELYFEPVGGSAVAEGEGVATLGMRLYAGSKDKYIEYVYSLNANSYEVGYTVNVVGLDDLLQANGNELGLKWNIHAPSKEKNIESERATSTIFYKYVDDDSDYISERNSEKIELVSKTKWVSFKQQYFSAAIIHDEAFSKVNSDAETRDLVGISDNYTKYMATNLTLPFPQEGDAVSKMHLYFGPNHYQTLSDLEIGLEDQIDLGWGIFGWVNEYLVIPVFNLLDGFNINYGIIILLLTLFIKLILMPFTYKTYVSSAKMKVLKPEMDELNEKHKDDDPLKKQQAVMALYRKAGVNPLAGCVPMLFQMPILYAMFRFFPASIELRQESFLWAHDLSSYDSIYNLGFEIPFYGDHISLFTLLMAVSTFLYTKYNTQMSFTSGPQAQQMKIMMYLMPVMLLGFFNNYSAGLSYYYFAANMVSILQQWVIKKWFVDEAAIHAQIQANKSKPESAKKSKFQQSLENMARKRGYDPNKLGKK